MHQKEIYLRVLIYFVILSAGFIVGVLLRRKARTLKILERLTLWAVFLLIFLLGAAGGASNEVIGNISKVGIQALVVSLGAMLGSAVLSYFVYVIWFRKLAYEE